MTSPARAGSSDSSAPVVRFEVRDRIATITLDRPGQGNAMTLQLCTELVDAVDRAEADDEVAVVVLTGSGRNFCVGADLAEGFHAEGREPHPRHRAFQERFGHIAGVPRDAGGVVTLRLAAMLKPLVVALNGAAVGGGASMVLPADIRVAGESTRLGFLFPRRGMVAESASSWFLPRLVGMARATEWVLTGRLLPAPELLASGLVARVVPDGEVVATALDVAREIAANTSTVAVALSRQQLWSMLGAASPWEAHAIESRGVYALPAQADVQEGVAAFLEKREPSFPMRVPRDYPAYGPRWPEPPPATPGSQ
ncbi:enoyl-CoA hydratase-related protein [Nocardioides daeguensis]|uniref:Crotonase/enoyl-CoA hydratase family protein n=1 Tax=Nocardioides daeguensis TaxID=908359 RepID=A0ABP6V6L1_9ACTN|nr:enoyl-CoA hydratase-related protein [Nocardioides daeguensis]MBV6726525.1 enoyl-CoA hydratase/isomerase family protein [Nocardioides daeguensis]MCR1772368.1 enoyl-CoA hydratase/isomerase family protein [Nocardioides daeguensis]